MVSMGCAEVKPELGDLPSFSEEFLEGGSWLASCFNRNGVPEIRKARYDGKTYRESAEYYSESYCSTQLFRLEESGGYVVGAKIRADSDARKLDRTIASVKLTPVAESVVTKFNTDSFCGFSDWAAGVSKEITGLTCDSQVMPSVNTKYYDIYVIWPFTMSSPYSTVYKGDLNFGSRDSGKDGSTEVLRPTAVTNPNFKRLSY